MNTWTPNGKDISLKHCFLARFAKGTATPSWLWPLVALSLDFCSCQNKKCDDSLDFICLQIFLEHFLWADSLSDMCSSSELPFDFVRNSLLGPTSFSSERPSRGLCGVWGARSIFWAFCNTHPNLDSAKGEPVPNQWFFSPSLIAAARKDRQRHAIATPFFLLGCAQLLSIWSTEHFSDSSEKSLQEKNNIGLLRELAFPTLPTPCPEMRPWILASTTPRFNKSLDLIYWSGPTHRRKSASSSVSVQGAADVVLLFLNKGEVLLQVCQRKLQKKTTKHRDSMQAV